MSTAGLPECRDCKELLAVLSEYLDGELDPGICDHLERHLAGCERCERFVDSLRRTVGHIRQAGPAELPEDLKREIVEAYRKLRA